MTDREIMQQALEALENYKISDDDRVSIAMSILQERLAQPEQSPLDRMAENARELGLDYAPVQEPVLYVDPNLDRVCTDKKLAAKYGLYIPLYAKPQSAAKEDNS